MVTVQDRATGSTRRRRDRTDAPGSATSGKGALSRRAAAPALLAAAMVFASCNGSSTRASSGTSASTTAPTSTSATSSSPSSSSSGTGSSSGAGLSSGSHVYLSTGPHQASFTLPSGWKVDTSNKSTLNGTYVTDGSALVFITMGKSSSSDVATDLQSDVQSAGATIDPSKINTTTPLGNTFDHEAYVSYQASSGESARAYELLDSASSDNFSAFVDIHAPSTLELITSAQILNLLAMNTTTSGGGY